MKMTLGKFNNLDTIVHRIDSRIKLIALIVLLVSVFLSYGSAYMNLVVYGGIFILLFLLTLLGKTSFLLLFRSLKGLWVMILFLLILNIFLPSASASESMVLFTLFGVEVHLSTILNVSYILLRLILVLMMTNIFTSTTKPMEMTYALEWLFYPLSLVRFPVHKLAMTISLALRFIPYLFDKTNQIMKAQASRGVDYRQGKFKDKIRAIVSTIIPLFLSSFQVSGELADAMEARGYDPDAKRTRYRAYRWSLKDTLSALVVLLFLGGMITLAVLKPDIFVAMGMTLPQ
ncbi:MAG TPA: energy-coupling factor transporter transmembrane protein EcfT [Candidatus Enterosoma merdigallinarum]|nr:energy-coupling factor transporter transmembrane protein EcfT [Candidatus Enterosoma merdigallinarum]